VIPLDFYKHDCLTSADDRHRYWLSRSVDAASTTDGWHGVLWLMLNPSTARGEGVNDPTQRRCVGFTGNLGAPRMGIVNLFTKSCADPAELFSGGYDKATGDPDAGEMLSKAFDYAMDQRWATICAWGKPSLSRSHVGLVAVRAHSVLSLWRRRTGATPLYCLGLTADNWPRHPLYLSGQSRLSVFDPKAMRN
jgi:hypothetical protein